MHNTKAFTLVELLVVISIIALLIAVLLPSLREAKEQAEIIVCKSNMKNYGLAISMYLNDNRQVFPHSNFCMFSYESYYDRDIIDEHPFQCRWHDPDIKYDGSLIPYLREVGVHCCPTFKMIARERGPQHGTDPGAFSGVKPHDASIPIEPRYSYTINGYLGKGNENEDLSGMDKELRMVTLGQVESPAETLFATEENIWVINTKNGDRLNVSDIPMQEFFFYPKRYGYRSDCIATFHKATDTKLNNGYSNVVFIDGHVGTEKAYDQEDIRRGFSGYSWTLATH